MDNIEFAREFARQLVRVLDVGDDADKVIEPLRRALQNKTTVLPEALEALINEALHPRNRLPIFPHELRAVAARFGVAHATVLQEKAATERSLADFSEDYGPAESLTLLNSMFDLSAMDGTIEDARASRLRQAADQLNVDPQLVAFLFRRHDLRHAAGDFVLSLEGHEIIIGRDEQADLSLPDPQVAPRHARLIRAGKGWEVEDLRSGRPTLCNGEPIRRTAFGPDDELKIGPYSLALNNEEDRLVAFGTQAFSTLSVRGLTRKIGGIHLLDNLSFTVFSGEVIAVLGPSGAGKTTLLSAITGVAPADKGEVLQDGHDFHRMLSHDPTRVGIVPQEDVVHAELTVEESLMFAGRLRFPPKVADAAIQVEVDRVLEHLGIENIRNNRIGNAERRGVSGGQRKRVNLGQELLTKTTRVMFLDEPTSGLDPQTAHDIVGLARQLADGGRTIFLVTHDVTDDLMAMVDHLLVLAPGGRLAWFGPPGAACRYFNVETVGAIFNRLGELEPREWRNRYRRSKAWRTWVGMREELLGLVGGPTDTSLAKQSKRSDAFHQYWTLVQRYSRVKMRDTVGTTVLLAQAPILGIAMMLAFPKPDTAFIFMLALSSLWFGASDAVREIIAERTIWRRDARNGVGLTPYLASKVSVLGVLVWVQCMVLVGLNFHALNMSAYGFDFLQLANVCTLTGMVGVSLGLWMSAMFPTSEAAIGSLPVLLIPQITFGGLIVTVKKMGAVAKLLSCTMVTRYAFEMAIKTGEELSIPGHRGGTTYQEHILAPLWDLGFRSSEATDMGFSMSSLAAILTGFFLVFLAMAALFTARSTKGN